MSSLTTDQEIALLEETKTAIFLIRQGLISLKWLKDDVDLAHLPILLISNGFERLLKTVICLNAFEENPDNPDFGKIETHNVEKLLKRVINIGRRWSYEKRCAKTKKDMVFLETCKDLRVLVKLLTKFGDKSGRYYNIDLLIGKKKNYNDPSKLFISYLDDKMSEGITDIICHITMLLQRFARALCRMFIWGELGQTGKDMANIVGYFLEVEDGDLGLILPVL